MSKKTIDPQKMEQLYTATTQMQKKAENSAVEIKAITKKLKEAGFEGKIAEDLLENIELIERATDKIALAANNVKKFVDQKLANFIDLEKINLGAADTNSKLNKAKNFKIK